MIKIIIPLISFLIINPLYAEIYKWTDSQGIVHFSDEPHPGAEKVILQPMQTTPSQSKTTESKNDASTNAASAKDEYKKIIIAQPESDMTIRNNQGYIAITVNTDPKIQPGDTLQLLFDGQPLGKPQASNVFTLNNVNRGAHTIAVQILDADGNVLNTSDAITIYMQRPRVGMVPQTRPVNTP